MSAFVSNKMCLYCNGPIQSRGPRRDTAVRFCSVQCRIDHGKKLSAENGTGRLTKACEICGKEFSFYRSMRPNASYCSTSCKSTGHARDLTGRIQEAFSSRNSFTKSMRRFFYDRCALCGWNEAPCDVCHIEARKCGGADKLDNVVMLCPNHHRVFDLGLIPVERIRTARQGILRPERVAQWQEWMRQRGRLANATRWHPDDTEAIAAAQRDLSAAREAIIR